MAEPQDCWPIADAMQSLDISNDESSEASYQSLDFEDPSHGTELEHLSGELGLLYDAHIDLIARKPAEASSTEINTAPLFTGFVWRRLMQPPDDDEDENRPKLSTQYGLLGGDVGTLSQPADRKSDPRVFQHVSAPSSTFICGSQGSGKSHTLSCMLENCLHPSSASVLPKPLTGVVFHYDTFSSDTGGSPCEAAYLSSSRDVKVRVLCAPTNVQTIKRIYSRLPNINVEELLIDHTDLNTKRMQDLMSFGTGQPPLYLQVVRRVLRDMRILQQDTGTTFSYANFKAGMAAEKLTEMQSAPLQQRLDTLESFMPKAQTGDTALLSKKQKKKGGTACMATSQAGQLTIVDLTCPCVTAEMACSLFNICLSLFLQQNNDIGKVVALDEAHKYMTESPESVTLTNNLLETIRMQRHLGVRVIISTQEPKISPKLLDLCSVTIVHRFSSPDWLQTLKGHLAGVSSASRMTEKSLAQQSAKKLDVTTVELDGGDPLLELFSIIVKLRVGEALVFAPSAIIGCDQSGEMDAGPRFVRLGHGILKMQVRARITADGGRSVVAV